MSVVPGIPPLQFGAKLVLIVQLLLLLLLLRVEPAVRSVCLDHANVGPAYERRLPLLPLQWPDWIYNGVPVLSRPDGTDKGEALNCDVGLALGGGVVGQALGDDVGQAPATNYH